MSEKYLRHFGFRKEPFTADIKLEDLQNTNMFKDVKDRIDYAIRLGSVGLITGDVGSGKSTALRIAAGNLHPSKYKILWITASSGSIMEFYRKVTNELDLDINSFSKAIMLRAIKREVRELAMERRRQPVIFVDEANLLQLDVFGEIHTITQFESDSKPWLPIIMAGQELLIDKFYFKTVKPLASRVVSKINLAPISKDEMTSYLQHHLAIAGVKTLLYEESAITAIHQDSGGLYRKANHLARGSLIAAASDKLNIVNENHVRLASMELL